MEQINNEKKVLNSLRYLYSEKEEFQKLTENKIIDDNSKLNELFRNEIKSNISYENDIKLQLLNSIEVIARFSK